MAIPGKRPPGDNYTVEELVALVAQQTETDEESSEDDTSGSGETDDTLSEDELPEESTDDDKEKNNASGTGEDDEEKEKTLQPNGENGSVQETQQLSDEQLAGAAAPQPGTSTGFHRSTLTLPQALPMPHMEPIAGEENAPRGGGAFDDVRGVVHVEPTDHVARVISRVALIDRGRYRLDPTADGRSTWRQALAAVRPDSGAEQTQPTSGGSGIQRIPNGLTTLPAPGGSTTPPTPGGSAVQPTPGGSMTRQIPGGSTTVPNPSGSAVQPTPGESMVEPIPSGSGLQPTPAWPATELSPYFFAEFDSDDSD